MDVFPPGCCHGLTRGAKTPATKEGLVCALLSHHKTHNLHRGEKKKELRKTSHDSGVTQVVGVARPRGDWEHWLEKNTCRNSSYCSRNLSEVFTSLSVSIWQDKQEGETISGTTGKSVSSETKPASRHESAMSS